MIKNNAKSLQLRAMVLGSYLKLSSTPPHWNLFFIFCNRVREGVSQTIHHFKGTEKKKFCKKKL